MNKNGAIYFEYQNSFNLSVAQDLIHIEAVTPSNIRGCQIPSWLLDLENRDDSVCVDSASAEEKYEISLEFGRCECRIDSKGAGIKHSEKIPLCERDCDQRLELKSNIYLVF